MIPLRIEATNLGAIPYMNIDLQNITLAGVVGSNGAGKTTALTIAPLFALFGATKNGCSVDDMVRRGTQEAAVTFEFEHRGEVYRATRTRSTKGRGKSTLELQQMVSGQWISESGTTVRETEDKIKSLLNLDAETFTASSMILQGRANEFTAKPPGQRKAILQQILGLDIYDQLLEAARVKERTANVELEKAKAKLSGLDERLKERPQAEKDRDYIKNELARVAGEIAAKEAELRKAEEDVLQVQVKADKAQEIKKQIDGLKAEVSKLEAEKQEQNERLAWANKRLDREAEIHKKATDYDTVKESITTLKARHPQLQKLEDEEKRIDLDVMRIEDELKTLEEQIKKAERLLADRPVLEKAAVQYREEVVALECMDNLAGEWHKFDVLVRERENEYRRILAEFYAKKDMLKAERKTLTDKAAMLADAKCIDIEQATCAFLADAKATRDKLKLIDDQEERMKIDASVIDICFEGLVEFENDRNALGYNPEEHHHLKNLVAELRPKAEQAAQLEGKAELFETLKQQQTRQREELQNLQQQIRVKSNEILSLTEELKPLPDLEKHLVVLATWVKAKDELSEERAKKEAAVERMKPLDTEITEKNNRIITLESKRSNFSKEIAELSDAKTKMICLNTEVGSLREEQNSLFGRQGAIRAKLESLAKDDEERQRVAAEIEPTAKSLVRWQTLVKAFGRDGIPALVIENAVPELERIANGILGQMTKGEHSLKFETQRDLKSKAGVAETLDIIVGDWSEERPYETFSGGEQLRIDFAIRFALAELLARRAGGKVEWLTVDEGLSSQDQEHRALVIEAIKEVATRFKKVFFITHVEEIKASFDQMIYFKEIDGERQIKIA